MSMCRNHPVRNQRRQTGFASPHVAKAQHCVRTLVVKQCPNVIGCVGCDGLQGTLRAEQFDVAKN